ncbi:MAG: acyl-CoA thioesterase [Roseiarcus sp.]
MDAAEFLNMLKLEPAGEDSWIGHSPDNGWKRVFGGQVVAQALSAAQQTVPDRAPHSLHAYFLLGGDPKAPIRFDVERIREGKSFATRRVVARQRGEAIFVTSVSFHSAEDGLDHYIPAPPAAAPEETPDPLQMAALAGETVRAQVADFLARIQPIEFRPLDYRRYTKLEEGEEREPKQKHWLRIGVPLPDDPGLHRVALAYLSDLTLLDAALVRHGHSIAGGKFQLASLDHAVWFHRPARADDWLLYVQDSPSAQGARGLTRGLLYNRAGSLVASVAQEGLMRWRRDIRPE